VRSLTIWATTRQFQQALGSDHFVATKVELLSAGDEIMDLSELGVVVDGLVNVDSTPVRRSGQITLVDQSGVLIPGAPDDPLAPAGNELRIWRGIDYQDGSEPELVPIGTLRFVVTEAAWPEISLECYDRAWAISGATLETNLVITSGTNYVTAISNVLTTAWGAGLPTNFPDTDEVTASLVFEPDADPWEIARELAANLGMVLWFDPMGVAQMTPEPDPSTDPPVWRFEDTDQENLALPGDKAVWDGTGNNAVIVIGENSDATAVFRSVWYDQDPASPTRYGGPFGKRPITVRDEKVTSQALADLRGRKELLARLGLGQTIVIPSMVNPALEWGDVVRCVSAHNKVDQVAILERFGVPLRASGTMTLEARARQVVT
jgi:hypothetical protein